MNNMDKSKKQCIVDLTESHQEITEPETAKAGHEPAIRDTRLIFPLLLAMLIMLVSMSAYEMAKQFMFPDISTWQSHLITIIFCSSAATLGVFFIIRKRKRILDMALEEIARRQQVEEKLERRKERYSLLIKHAPIGLLSIDPQGNIIDVNAAMLSIMGSPSAEATKEINVLSFEPLVKAGIVSDFHQCMKSGAVVVSERPYTSKWGKHVYMRLHVAPILDDAGHVTYVQLISEDITVRKQAEEDRENLINELEEALDNIKTLKGFIPICASCKKIRNDEGFWQDVTVYVREHSEAEFTHGICPECKIKLYPDLFSDD